VNLAALVAYDGTRFAGFQRQSPDKGPTVQGTLEAAFQRIAGVPITVEGAGRTDSGVHASGQVVNAHVPARFDPPTWQRALNALLPSDVAIRATCAVPDAFRARRSALARSYQYRILCDAIRSPLRERYAWRVPAPLDLPAMARAVVLLPGERDFGAFGSSPQRQPDGAPAHTVRTLLVAECEWRAASAGGAPAFLSGMVRRLVGTLVLVGEGRFSLADFQAILEARDKNHPGTAAPACGLCLTGVEYPFGLIAWSS
jgi:tRNA pseudouridine38-40 synthase